MSASLQPFLEQDKASACVHCGLCLSACPTYLETGNENLSPRGRIHLMRAIQDGRTALDQTTARPIDLCLGCRACETACPSGVEYGALLESTREFVERCHRRSWPQRLLRRVFIEGILPFPRRFKLAVWAGRLARAGTPMKWIPPRLRRLLALLPERLDSTAVPSFSPASGPTKGQVGLVEGCVMKALFAGTHRSTIQLINRAGFDSVIPRGQSCCGALYAHSGNLELARRSARRNIAAFETDAMDTILTNAAGCGSTLKEYVHLLRDDPFWAERAARFSARVRDLTEWLVEQNQPLQWRGEDTPQHANPVSDRKDCGFSATTYHDACHLAHAQRVSAQPRVLLAAVSDAMVDLPEAEVCCGSAGTYNLTEPGMSHDLLTRKIANILASGAGTVVTSNPGCILQIEAGLREAGRPDIRVIHIADFLVEKLQSSQRIYSGERG